MPGETDEDPLLDSFQQWQLGIFVLFMIAIVGSVSAIVLQSLSVPYAETIGGIGGAVITFLAVSYWFYGR